MTSALVLIDLMPRIVALPLAPYAGEEVLARCRVLADSFRRKDLPVVLVRVERPNVAEQPAGSELVQGLAQAGDLLVVKRTVGAFYGTGLDAQLRQHEVDRLVLAGLVTNMGVESTARAGSDHGYELEFVEDAMSGLAEDEHVFAVEKVFPRFGEMRMSSYFSN
jgi:nicotinamidase-related amidase